MIFTIKGLANLLYPVRCLICGLEQGSENALSLCGDCAAKIRSNQPPFCRTCGRSMLNSGSSVGLCAECNCKRFYFSRAWSCYIYEGVIKECLHLFKYKKKISLARPLAQLMEKFMKRYVRSTEFDIIVPVPLYRSRMRQREYNQSLMLAEHISSAIDVPLVPNGLYKRRNTMPQSGLSKAERAKNLSGVFACAGARKIIGKRILLVDDVITTGSTIDECSKALLSGGAQIVCGLSLARGE